ncbi:hypothetical protein RAA17_14630 [Komagataeibacter rhaeticus]|nr:hypothetical protein [Komagataeibacter rhaeticus]
MATRRIIASTSFRIVTLFASLFILGGMVMTVMSGLYSQSTMRQQIRREVENEGHETFADAGVADVRHLMPVVQGLIAHEPGFHYLLQDPAQAIVAGNMLHLRPVPGERWLAWSHRLPQEANRDIVYGIGYLLDDGGYYFVGMDASPDASAACVMDNDPVGTCGIWPDRDGGRPFPEQPDPEMDRDHKPDGTQHHAR